ncbi:MAG: AAA family ATPase [Eubacteriales bacterium]|nr:AAA family ATPase [Eubacteriales bacterium]
MLQGIHCRGYAILEDFTLGLSWAQLKKLHSLEEALAEPRLQALTCLIGRASTGKTSAFEALRFISESLKQGVPEAASALSDEGFASMLSYNGNDQMHFALVFYREKEADFLNYQILIKADRYGRPRVAAEEVIHGAYLDGSFVETQLLQHQDGEGRVYSQNFGAAEINLLEVKMPALSLYGRFLQYPELCWLYLSITRWFITSGPFELKRMPARKIDGINRHLTSDFENATNVLDYYEARDREQGRAGATVQRILEKMPDFKLTGDIRLDRELTSGNLKLFLYYLLLEDNRPLICLDGPELGLYHERVEDLVTEMRIYLDVELGAQIFLSSHSTVLLDTLAPAEVWLLERKREAGADKALIQARWLGSDDLIQKMAEEGISLGSLWYSGHLDFQ